jgi:hypothetical protein
MKRSRVVAVGKFTLQVEEVSARDVRRLEAAAAGNRNIRIIATGWRRLGRPANPSVNFRQILY